MNMQTAFPRAGMSYPNGEFDFGEPGMTLRDYFAAKALTGMLSNETYMTVMADAADEIKAWSDKQKDAQIARRTSENAFLFADAMLAAREVKATP